MSREWLPTTVDNPWNPFTQYDEWYAYDHQHGWNTIERLARLTFTSDALSDAENEAERDRAFLELMRLDFMNVYRKFFKDSDDSSAKSEKTTKTDDIK